MRKTNSVALSRALLKIEGRAVEVTMRLNPRARRLIVKVHPSTGEVSVVAPSKRSLTHALDFARGESDWIAKKLSHVPEPVAIDCDSVIPFRGRPHRIVAIDKGSNPVWVEDGSEPRICVSGRREHAGRRVRDFLKAEARRRLGETNGALFPTDRTKAETDCDPRHGKPLGVVLRCQRAVVLLASNPRAG